MIPSNVGGRTRPSNRLLRGPHATRRPWAGILDRAAQRKQDPDHKTRLVVRQLDSAAMRDGDPLGDGKTKPAAAAGAAAVHLEERFEYLATVLSRNARAPIRDLQA